VAGHADEGDDSCLNTMLEGKCAFVGKGGQALQLRSRMGAN
jgi:hypothetical protein